ncbi:MAG TPA: copper homeostasis protein CutC [Gemmatimonadales bacterium]|nr:copper homeostasis protein CutC [Gemmatimonadales bacterium]
MIVEACVDTLQSARAAAAGGANRIELCDNLADGGTTPSHGVAAIAAAELAIPVVAMLRPRGGTFVCDADDLTVMRADARLLRDSGVAGVALGVLTADGAIDTAAIAQFRDLLPDADLTFHRAFDVCRDAPAALEALIVLGVDRVLTSGQQATAWEGRGAIAELVGQAGDRITILAGGSIDEHNAAALIRATGVREIHVRGTRVERSTMQFHDTPVPFRRPLPADESLRSVTDAARVAAICAAARG